VAENSGRRALLLASTASPIQGNDTPRMEDVTFSVDDDGKHADDPHDDDVDEDDNNEGVEDDDFIIGPRDPAKITVQRQPHAGSTRIIF
jgi:hypothetical protein